MADDTALELKIDLGETIIKKFKMEGCISQRGDSGIRSPHRILDEICGKLQNNSTVLLIDEYDAPLTHHINQEEELNNITKILNNFYATVKQYTGKFRLIFITGVTRASHVSIFSGFNNLKDLSLKKEFNALLGFTQNDLLQYFDTYIENAAHILNMQKDAIYKRMKHYYDGFQFSLDSEETLYNPWSILNFLDSPQEGFCNYWFDSGGTPSIIMNYLKINDSLDFLDYSKRDTYIEVNKIPRKYKITNIPINILLYQTGYLTIRNEHDGTAHLVVPNTEVEESLLMLRK